MTAEESPGSTWWREQNRRRTDPDERTADRANLQRRLFGEPDDSQEPAADNPDDGPNDGPNPA